MVQRYPVASSPRGHPCNIARRYRPGTVVAPVSSPPRYRRGKRYVKGIGGRAGQFDRGKVTRVGWIGQTSYLGVPPNRCQSNDTVIQRRSTTQDQISAIRIGVGQLPVRLGVEMQALRTHQPPPWLRVMDRRGSRRQSQDRPDCARIGKARVHGYWPLPDNAVLSTIA